VLIPKAEKIDGEIPLHRDLCYFSDKKFTYTYDKDSKAVQMKIQGMVEPEVAKVYAG
jgi:hypothetical protein